MGEQILQISRSKRFRPYSAYIGKKQCRMGRHLYLFFICIMTPILMCGCSHFSEDFKAGSRFEEANALSIKGDYQASLSKYEHLVENYPAMGDRALFEMSIIHSSPKNEQKDHQKSLDCLQKLIKDYPASAFRQDSEMMIFYINNVTVKDRTIATQQKQIETLQQEVKNKEHDIITLQKKVEELEKKIFDLALQNGSADRIVIEKKQRRLRLVSKGEVLKTYKIALGGDPDGPKVKQGDNKTPEGTYSIVSRNKDSRYHLSLHISYPNEKDKKRANELGVSPGGNIMIHGLKNGFSWVGDFHAESDWTKGCIAVTNEEIEEIGKLAQNGTAVEIKP